MVFGFQAAVGYKDKIYFSEIRGFGLFSYDYKDKTVEFCTMFDEVDCLGYALHRKSFLYGNEAWFIPQVGEYISCVNLDNYRVERIPVNYRKKIARPERLLTDGIVVENKLVCVPFDIDTLVIIDLDTHIPHFISDFIDPEIESIGSIGLQGEEVVFYPQKGEYIRFLDLNNEEVRKERRYDNFQDYGKVAIYNEGYIFLPGKKHEILIRGIDGDINTIKYGSDKSSFCGFQQVGNKIVFFPSPYVNDKFISIDIKNPIPKEVVSNEYIAKDYYVFIQIPNDNDEILLSSGYQGRVFKINIDTLEISSYIIEEDSQIIRKQIETKMEMDEKMKIYKVNDNNILYESDWRVSLESFLNYIIE